MNYHHLLPCLIIVSLRLGLVQISHAQNSPQDFLDPHNAARKAVGVEPLIWDGKIAAYALAHAELVCHKLRYSKGRLYGENVVRISGDSPITAARAVRSWIDEKINYYYDSNTCADYGRSCYSYTQVVWRNSTQLGCARVKCLLARAGYSFVCNYYPPGNYHGQKPY